MTQHPNARPAPRGREAPVSRIGSGVGVAEAARQMGVSRQTASKRLRRGRSGEGMDDRSSRPLRPARLTPPEAEERVREAGRTMLLLRNGSTPGHGTARPGGRTPSRPSSSAIIGSACGGPAAHVAHRRRKQPVGTQQLGAIPAHRGSAAQQRIFGDIVDMRPIMER